MSFPSRCQKDRSSRKSNKKLRVIQCGILLIAFALEGCDMLVVRSKLSSPKSPMAEDSQRVSTTYGYKICGSRDTISFELHGLKLSARTENRQDTIVFVNPPMVPLPVVPWIPGLIYWLFSYPEPSPTTWINVEFDPEGEAFSFDPAQVTLRVHDKELKATGFTGLAATCLIAVEYKTIHKAEGRIPLGERTCFRLMFNISLSPDQSFSLSIGGIEKGGKSFPVPPIYFERGSVWELHIGSDPVISSEQTRETNLYY